MTEKRLTLDETLEALILGYACAAEAEMPNALENGVDAIKETFKEYGYRLVQPLSPISEEETFNLAFKTPYKSMSHELSIYTQGLTDGANAQLAADRKGVEK